jgi:hypothetical protein
MKCKAYDERQRAPSSCSGQSISEEKDFLVARSTWFGLGSDVDEVIRLPIRTPNWLRTEPPRFLDVWYKFSISYKFPKMLARSSGKSAN